MTGQLDAGHGEARSATDRASPEKSEEIATNPSPKGSRLSRIVQILRWAPKRCRWDPQNPPVFTLGMNILFGCAGASTVANLYYNQPILNILANDFGVSYETVSRIPTLAQSGYSAGLFLLCPLGDLLPRRPYTLCVILFTATVWLGLCLTKSFLVFEILSFITGVTTVTPQLMLPLVADLSPPNRRAANLSVVVSGNIGGILIARILSGVVTNYVHWRVIYWIALGMQYSILVLLFLFMPDYPSTNPDGVSYPRLLYDVVRMLFKHPVLVQSSLIGFGTSATFTSFWTTLTFLFAGPPYHYSPLIIGLFALIIIPGIIMSPIYARTFIDKIVPMASAFIGQLVALTGVLIGTFVSTHNIAGPILFAFLLDAGFQITQIANRSAIYSCEPKGRNRVNTAFMVVSFLGQVTGTSAGNKLYARYGWYASGGLSIGLVAFSIFLLTLRGPYEDRWIGWRGGFSFRKRHKMSADGRAVEQTGLGGVAKQEARPGVELEKGNVERAFEEAAAEDVLPDERVMKSEDISEKASDTSKLDEIQGSRKSIE